MRAISAFAFSLIITYELVYHSVELGLNPLQLVTVGVLLECMTFFFEIPTGIVADAYSRRLSVLIGFFLIGTGFLIEGVVPSFAAVLVGQVLWGLGFTFYSGAGDAWLTDEIGEAESSQAFLRGMQIGQVMTLLGVIAGAFLVNYGLKWPIIGGALLYYLVLAFLLWMMTETGYQPAERQPGQGMLQTIVAPFQEGVQLVKARPILVTILLVGAVIGLSIGGFDRLYASHFTDNFVLPDLGPLEPLAWFSILSALIAIASIVGSEYVRRRVDTTQNAHVARLLFSLYSGMIVLTLIFALTHWFYMAAASFCISQALRNVGRPLLIIWINQNAESSARATVISMYWQSNAFGQIAGSPIIGWVGVRFSVRAALTVGTLVYISVLPLLRGVGRISSSDIDRG